MTIVYLMFVFSIYRFVQKRLMALAEDGRSIVNELFWYKRNSGPLKKHIPYISFFLKKNTSVSFQDACGVRVRLGDAAVVVNVL